VEKATGKEYAVKIVSRKIDSAREISLLRLCQGHPNIVNLYNVYHDEVRTKNVDATEELLIRGSRTELITILLLFIGAHIHRSRASQRR
jgi:serine/threonine protein kinase